MKVKLIVLLVLINLPFISTKAQKLIPKQINTENTFQQLKLNDLSQHNSREHQLLWYAPQETLGVVGQYEKLEIGIAFDSLINAKLLNYSFRQTGDKINPFNPEEIDVYAEFWVNQNGQWYGPIRVNGFYYQDYLRTNKGWSFNREEALFRIRFAPEFKGLWRCRVTANITDEAPMTFDEFTFEVIASSNKGFVRVGDNKRYLRVGQEPFFPIGQNLTGPNNPSHTLEWGNKTAAPVDYLDFQTSMTELAAAGANYFRYIISPWQTEIEFEELGNYSNRMPNAWEFDQILEHAKDLNLKIHLNLAMHYSFEAPNGYAMTDWDWSAAGDELNPSNSPCFKRGDKGYCYRNELNLEKPIDFLTDSLAIVYYKRRLRYMVARWGYSTSIGVMELMSEANNFGNEALVDIKTINGKYGCYNLSDTANIADQPYKDFPEVIIPKLMNWQIEMCRYLKEELGLTTHPLAVSYTGEPDFFHGDSTYFSPYVDIATFNNYGVSIDKFEKNYLIVTGKYHSRASGYFLDKPFMHSEYGPGGSITNCDEGVRYIKTINLTPFSGLAGSGINWHFHWNEDSMWNYLKPIAQLMDSIPLDAENWQAGEPIVSKNKEVEVMYLYRPKIEGYGKAVGVISNRTFNFSTGGLDRPGSDCKADSIRNEFKATPLYSTPIDFSAEELKNELKLGGMGASNVYMLEWYNALSGDFLGEFEVESSVWGKINLNYPGVLTGSNSAPLLFFKIYPKNESIYSVNGDVQKDVEPIDKLSIVTNLPSIKITEWQ